MVALSVLTGCAHSNKTSDGKHVLEPVPEDIYRAKIAFCENVVSYEQVTQFAGNDRTLSPEKRRAEKDKVWTKWITDLEKTKEDISGRVYFIEIPTLFGDYDEQHQRMRLLNFRQTMNTSNRFSRYSMVSAIPDKIFFNSISNHMLPVPIPQGATSKWILDYYGNVSFALSDTIYVINVETTRFKQGWVSAQTGDYGVPAWGLLNEHLGIIIDTSQWTSKQQSPIFKEDENVYLNLKKLNFVDAFGVYPDTGNVTVDVSYLFEITDCNGGVPNAVLKEVIVNAENKERGSKRQIGRVIM